jgi:hypothetical protein
MAGNEWFQRKRAKFGENQNLHVCVYAFLRVGENSVLPYAYTHSNTNIRIRSVRTKPHSSELLMQHHLLQHYCNTTYFSLVIIVAQPF